MGPASVTKGESSSKVALKVLNLLDVLQELGIDGLLGGLQLLSPLVLLGLALLGLLESVLGSVLELVLGESGGLLEERVVNVDIDASKGDLGGGRKDIGGVHSAERNSVDCVRSSHKEVS